MREHRFDSGSTLRDPRRFFGEMGRDLRASRELGWRLFLRDFRAQHRGTLLGVVWTLIPPLSSTALLLCLNRTRVLGSHQLSPLFIVVGMLIFQTFVDCVLAPLKVAESCRGFITKIRLPYESLVIAGVLHCAALFSARLLILGAASIYSRYLPAPLAIVFFFIGAATAALLGTAIGVIVAPIGLLFRDVQIAISLSLGFLLFLTPVGYVLAPSSASLWYFKLNPLSPLLKLARDGFFGVPLSPGGAVPLVAVAAAGLLLFAWCVMRVSLPIVLERVGA